MARVRGKKILYVITKGTLGGAQKYVLELAKFFSVANTVGCAIGTPHQILAEKLAEYRIPVFHIPHLQRDIAPLSDLRALFALIALIRRERPDIVHLNSTKAGVLGAFAARLARTPYIIFTAHGWAHRENRPFLQRAFFYLLEICAVLLCHTVITVSRADADALPYYARKRTTVIPNGITPPVFLSATRARTHLFTQPPPRTSIIVGTISELTPNKGLRYALAGMTLLPPQVVCVIIGDGEERSSLEAFINEHKLQGRVHLVGYQPDAARYLKAFDIFFLSSLKEGFPYALLEAGAAGLPVIATAVGGVPELIEDLATGIVIAPKRPDEFARAVTFLIEHPRRAAAYAQALQERVRKNYSLETMYHNTEALYALKPNNLSTR